MSSRQGIRYLGGAQSSTFPARKPEATSKEGPLCSEGEVGEHRAPLPIANEPDTRIKNESLLRPGPGQRSDIYYFCGTRPDPDRVASMIQAAPNLLDQRAEEAPHGSPIHFAAREGHMAVLKVLTDAGAKVDLADSRSRTALNKATRQGQFQVVRFMIEECGADFLRQDALGLTLLHDCSLSNNRQDDEGRAGVADMLRYLMDEKGLNPLRRDTVGRTPFDLALELDPPNLPVLRELYPRCCPRGLEDVKPVWFKLASRAQIRSMAALLKALPRKEDVTALLSSRDAADRTCLHLVAKHGKPEAIRQVLRWGLSAYDAEVDGNLPVHLSIIYGHGEAFELLLDDRSEAVRNREGRACLQLALSCKRFGMADTLIARLLRRGERLEAAELDDHGNNLLLQAVSADNLEAVVYLSGKGLLHYRNRAGERPLHCAVLMAHSCEMARALIKAGADVDGLDNMRKTALHHAAHLLHDELVALLLAHNADPYCRDLADMTPLEYAEASFEGRAEDERQRRIRVVLEDAMRRRDGQSNGSAARSQVKSCADPVPTGLTRSSREPHPAYRIMEQIHPQVKPPAAGPTHSHVSDQGSANSFVFLVECIEAFDPKRHAEGEGMEAQQAYILKCAPTDQQHKVAMLTKEVEFSDVRKALPLHVRRHFCHLYASGHGFITGVGECYYLINEYCPLRDMASYIREVGTAITENQVLSFSRQMASALAYLHNELKRVHLDLKPENVALRSTDGELQVKILDFGISHKVFSTSAGAMGYAVYYDSITNPPEHFSPRPRVTVKMDVFKLGALMMQLACRQLMAPTMKELNRMSGDHAWHFLKDVPLPLLQSVMESHGVRPQLILLVLHMLQTAPEARPSMAEVVEALDQLIAAAAREHRSMLAEKRRAGCSAEEELREMPPNKLHKKSEVV